MTVLERPPVSARVCDILCRLGVRAETTGFYFAAYAVDLVCVQPQRVTLVTKWLYPDVARAYKTSVFAVERGIRLAVSRAWKGQAEQFEELFPDGDRPTSSRFISKVAMYLIGEGVA